MLFKAFLPLLAQQYKPVISVVIIQLFISMYTFFKSGFQSSVKLKNLKKTVGINRLKIKCLVFNLTTVGPIFIVNNQSINRLIKKIPAGTATTRITKINNDHLEQITL